MKRMAFLLSLMRLGDGYVAGIKIALLYIFYRYTGMSVRTTLRILIEGRPYHLVVGSASDFWVIKDILIDKEYKMPLRAEPQTIIDLGSNTGISVLFFAATYPNAHIHAVEPNPRAFALLRENTKSLPHISLHQLAIGAQDGAQLLHVGNHSTGGSLVARDGEKVKVAVVTPNTFLARIAGQVDLLKFDIEGAETCLFRGFKHFENVRAFVGEIHYDLSDLTPAEIRSCAAGYEYAEAFPARSDRSILQLQRV